MDVSSGSEWRARSTMAVAETMSSVAGLRRKVKEEVLPETWRVASCNKRHLQDSCSDLPGQRPSPVLPKERLASSSFARERQGCGNEGPGEETWEICDEPAAL